MKFFVISTRTIIMVPLLFIIVAIIKISADYYSSESQMHDFVRKQASTLNDFMIVHRDHYQELYINKTIPLDEKTLEGLPAFSASKISQKFSDRNYFGITVKAVSDKARNKINSADESELKAINFFKSKKSEKEYFVNEGSFYQYATPLFINEKCLTCHGKKEDAPLFISQRYKNAYDYKLGELRGVISIKVPKDKISTYFTSNFFKAATFDVLAVSTIFLISLYLIKYFRNLSKKLKLQVKRKTKELTQNIASLKSHQLALDESSIVSKTGLDGKITYVNDNFCKITGYTKEELIGQEHSFLNHPDTPADFFDELWATITSKKVWKGIIQNRGKNGDYWVDAYIVPLLDDNDEIVEFIAVRHDMSRVIKQQKTLDNIANTDTLTGFGSRYKLTKDIENSTNPALAILNIDSFSQINDFYGHTIGDMLIQKVGDEINHLISKENCELYHLQGDEYVVFNKDIKREKFIDNLQRLSSKISKKTIEFDDEKLNLNFTTALSFEEKEKLLSSAEMAFKVAKKEGQHFIIYSDEISLNQEYQNNIEWARKIKEAIEEDRIIPVFQPIVNNSGNWEKYESLVRLKDRDGKLIAPYFFLEISKKTRHYSKITQIMIEKTFEKFKDREVEFSINLTIEDILNSEIKNYIFEMLEKYKIGNRVVFEIVESESIENFEEISKFIQEVKSYSCKIAIDDFGTGYSNFEYLMKLKSDYIKIDGSLIKDIVDNKDAQIVVSAITDFAKKLGMKTVAEFVESEAVMKKVQDLGIDYCQGYYFSKPEIEPRF